MNKKYFLYIVAAVLACACSSDKPEECYIPKNTVEFAGNAFSSFSLGGDVKLHSVQNPENTSEWTIQAVVPVRKEVATPIEDLTINLVMLDDRGVRVRDGLVLQGEDLANLLPVGTINFRCLSRALVLNHLHRRRFAEQPEEVNVDGYQIKHKHHDE